MTASLRDGGRTYVLHKPGDVVPYPASEPLSRPKTRAEAAWLFGRLLRHPLNAASLRRFLAAMTPLIATRLDDHEVVMQLAHLWMAGRFLVTALPPVRLAGLDIDEEEEEAARPAPRPRVEEEPRVEKT